MTKTVFRDFDEFADAINGIAGRFVPTARSEAEWFVQVVPVGSLTMQQVQIGGASTFAGDGADSALTLGIPVAQSKRIRIDGQPLDDSSFILVKEGQPFTFAAKQTTLWAGITVPVEHPSLSQELLASLNSRSPDTPSATHTRAHLEHVMRARALVSRLCSEDGSVSFLDPAAARAAEEEIMIITSHVLEASSRALPKRIGRPQFSRDRVIARALAFIEERRGEPLLIQDLCGATQVSERTLRTIFQEHFGVGPMRLLKVRQLREIRCALMSPEASDHTVTKIAARFGVWDYSLFARNYKALYGETPLETLRNGTAARNRANVGNPTWLRYAARKFSDARYPSGIEVPVRSGLVAHP
jgi:AraC family ethanolamine operon transcriptional activator